MLARLLLTLSDKNEGRGMRIRAARVVRSRRSREGFNLVEVLISVSSIGVLTVSLYMALTQGFAVIQLARENLRATQILQEKMETMRVYNWDQINAPGFVPTTFSEPFYAVDAQDNGGFNYTGQVVITNAPATLASTGYASDLRLVIIQVQWMSGNAMRRREARSLVSQYGLHSYVY